MLAPPAPVGAAPQAARPQVLRGGQPRIVGVEQRHTFATLPAPARGAGPVEAPPRTRRPHADGPARTQGVKALAPTSSRRGGGPRAAASSAAAPAPTSALVDPSIEQLAEW